MNNRTIIIAIATILLLSALIFSYSYLFGSSIPNDPFWFNSSSGATPTTGNISELYMELGSRINITANISGVSSVCVDIDHPAYGNNYTCGSPNANFLFNISYFRNNQFNDSSTIKNISLKDNPYYSICYQETANASTNFDGNCNLSYEGSYLYPSTNWNNPQQAYDGNWSVYENGASPASVGTYSLYINYTKALDSIGAIWQVAGWLWIANITIPQDCWDYSQNDLTLRIDNVYVNSRTQYCYNSTNWKTIGDSYPYMQITEEAMIWNVTIHNYTNSETFYVKQHQYDEIVNASINVTGFISGVVGDCYQETANVSTACGGLATGNYRNVSFFDVESNIYDGNWNGNPAMYGGTENATIFINYTKPTNSYSAKWRVKDGSPPDIVNLTINVNCFNQFNLQLKAVSSYNDNYVYWDCYNGSNWLNLRKGGHGDDPYIWEEAIIWNKIIGGTYPTNVKIYINNTLSNNLGLVYTGDITLDHFNDDSTSKTLTFYEPETQTMYLHLPKNAVVSNARFNITGLYQQNTTCFQESATLENSCGALSTGSYGEKVVFNATWANNDIYMLMNYTIPSSVVSSRWQIKHGRNPVIFANYTINSSCLRSDGKINLAIKSKGAQKLSCFTGGCFNNSNNFIPLTSTYDCGNVEYTSQSQSTWGRGHDSDYDSDVFSDAYGTTSLFKWKSGVGNSNAYNNATLWEEAVIWDYGYNISNPSIEVGIIDGVYEWNNSGMFNTTQRINNFSSSIMNYLANCEADENGFCEVPIYVSVPQSPGMILLDNIEINYEDNPNPIYLSLNPIRSFLGNSSGFANIPIKFESFANGTLQISDIRLDYRGGNKTTSILVYSPQASSWVNSSGANQNKDYLTDKLNVYYNFNNATGNLIDTFSGLYNFTQVGTVPSASGIIGNSRGTYGTIHYFTKTGLCGDDFETNNFTISVWTKLITEQIYGPIWSNFVSQLSLGKGIAIQSWNNQHWEVQKLGSGGETNIYLKAFINYDWTHIVVRRAGTNLSVWINGTLDNSATITNDNLTGDKTYPCRIGMQNSVTDYKPYNGYIDELAIWNNRALNSTEISDLYNNGNSISYQPEIINETLIPLNETLNIITWYSKWGFNFPRYINYLEFIPNSPTSKNVTPYGQTTNAPIFNITTYNYGGNADLFFYINKSSQSLGNPNIACVDLYMATTSTKPLSTLYDNLTFYYPFDTDTINKVDKSNFNGVIVGNLTTGSDTTRNSYYYNFPGSSGNHIYVSTIPNSIQNGSFTVSAWVKVNKLNGSDWMPILRLGSSSSSNDITLEIRNESGDQYFTLGVYNGTSWNHCYYTNSSLATPGVWNHIVGVFNNSNGQNTSIYLNGVLANATESKGLRGTLWSSNLIIGGRFTGETPYVFMNGSIDDVMLWNRILTASEISTLYNQQKGNYSSIKMTDDWQLFEFNKAYLSNNKLWLWADYSCNYTSWNLWNPDIYIRGCCSDCVCSEDLI